MKLTVLVVDDVEAVRMTMARALRRAGYDVLEAGSGAEALAFVRIYGDRIAALITDVHLDEAMSGSQLAGEVQSRWPATPILFTSGVTFFDFEHFLAKPFDATQLVTTVDGLTGRRA